MTCKAIFLFIFLMGILAIIKSRSIPMTKAKLLSLAPMELLHIIGCPSNYATLQLHSKGA
jgi:hypothetical protein